jgi:hypothetical protein
VALRGKPVVRFLISPGERDAEGCRWEVEVQTKHEVTLECDGPGGAWIEYQGKRKALPHRLPLGEYAATLYVAGDESP